MPFWRVKKLENDFLRRHCNKHVSLFIAHQSRDALQERLSLYHAWVFFLIARHDCKESYSGDGHIFRMHRVLVIIYQNQNNRLCLCKNFRSISISVSE